MRDKCFLVNVTTDTAWNNTRKQVFLFKSFRMKGQWMSAM